MSAFWRAIELASRYQTPQEVEAFVNDKSPLAYEQLTGSPVTHQCELFVPEEVKV